MNSSALPLEFELQANAIAASAYPHTRYSLISEIDNDCVSIEFKGFFIEEFDSKNRPHQNPIDNYYRNSKADFSLMYFPKGGHLILSGWWRGVLLALHYDPGKQLWLSEDGDEINTPYPDGDCFESMASSLQPILQKYFKIEQL